MSKKRPTNKEIINRYLKHYRHSPQSVNMRKSSLNYFFGKSAEKCFGYQGHIFDINTAVLIDFFEWLKNLDLVSIQTRKNKWAIIKSLLQYTMEYYNAKGYKVYVVIPSKTVDWKGAIHKKGNVESNANVIATKKEIETILNYFKVRNFKHYLIIRILVETGMRKGELIKTKYYEFDAQYRHFKIKEGKTDEKLYNVSKKLSAIIHSYVKTRRKINTNEDYLFLTKSLKKYSDRSINLFLSSALKKLGIIKNITTKTFRKTLNTLRKKEMGCAKEDRKRLVGHKTSDVNIRSYTIYDYKDNIELYDRYNPYINCNF